jgi:hypothetical protein
LTTGCLFAGPAVGKAMESRWSDGQIELFHALGKICERVGREGAAGMYLRGFLRLDWVLGIGVLAAGLGSLFWRCA